MTNEKKYKTTEERSKAHTHYCRRNECPTGKDGRQLGCGGCAFRWLTLEAEDEKPEPCPFCGESMDGRFHSLCPSVWYGQCSCGYKTKDFLEKDEAIAEHNRVARAIKAAKEAEAESIKEDIEFVKGALNEVYCLQDGSVSESCTNAWEAVNKIKRRFGMIRDAK